MDIYINPPKRIETTVDQFKSFTYFELSSFFINHGACVQDNGDSFRIWTSRYELVHACMKNHRFRGIDWYEKSNVELYFCDITEDNLKGLIRKSYEDLFLR
ncbi:hypothetical protein BK764_13740 [Bacillus thuringiensis serovar israelensis]|uniref:Uncharacterized protein n=2 Tax=Bacillus thuringiensis TaxID=1428 RepID=A0A9W3JWW4_BACTU|nr:hypothetical protein [Bacillus thuringiensis]AFQ30330.1 hypothetical protein BTF1_31147 [Bacillus thuringiensis HD-789]AJH02442.1 hypothetical protein AS86_6572 [Bacillus thuringiensis HD1002]KRD76593.1 hypothetical protein ASE53_20020 [Bacillus sp. Root11]KRD82174.1 hypothetical protein ASE54_19550 [Bacillus sp. Root131]MED1155048.1 hypothetical protein [Bacillus paranthracis]RCX38637.1 hypothetical protein DEU45_106145 [Bacillus sp. AG102]